MAKKERWQVRRSKKSPTQAVVVLFAVLVLAACTHHVQIEPSDKPFVVNLNVKVQVEDQNRDLLNLEEEAKAHKKSKSGGKPK